MLWRPANSIVSDDSAIHDSLPSSDEPGFVALQPTDLREIHRWTAPRYVPAGKLQNKVALVTAGHSDLGRAVAYLFAREGAHVVITYPPSEQWHADLTRQAIEFKGRRCLLVPHYAPHENLADIATRRADHELGSLDILVCADDPVDPLLRDFNLCLIRAATPQMNPGSAVIVTESTPFTHAGGLLQIVLPQLTQRGIRINCVAPDPRQMSWLAGHSDVPMACADSAHTAPAHALVQPEELAPTYVFLASDVDSGPITGMVLPAPGKVLETAAAAP